MRARLPQGVHVPHPRIAATTGRLVEVHIEGGELPMTVDGVVVGSVSDLTVTVIPGALRLAI
jgi:hypothetical protein